MNLSDLRARVRALTGIPSTSILSDAILDAYINEAYRDVATAYDWPWITNTWTFTGAGYDPAVGVQLSTSNPVVRENRVLQVYVDSPSEKRVLTRRSRWTVNEQDPPVYSGTPDEYVFRNGYIFLAPYPSYAETYKVDYLEPTPSLSLGTDEPLFDDEFHVALAYGAAVRALIAEGDDTERRNYYRAQFLEIVEQMREEYLAYRDKSTLRLGGRISWRNRRNTRYGQ